ncbi:hypothetical protein [Streptomyces sp. NBC_00344]|uniref:hypothetical protein n=1 Tax=Streptomyces sp. NBC_00344 TaxID=2975720 RepID=UPI002E24A84F
MNVRRILTAAAAASALVAAIAPVAQASDLDGTLGRAASTASAVGDQAKPVTDSVVGKKIGTKVRAVKRAASAGGDVLKAGNELVR